MLGTNRRSADLLGPPSMDAYRNVRRFSRFHLFMPRGLPGVATHGDPVPGSILLYVCTDRSISGCA